MASLEQVSIATTDGFRLEFSPGLERDLRLRIAVAANAIPKRGLEVCGLLLGEQTENTFVVKSVVPLTCRYSEGPAFRAGEADLREQLRLMQPLGEVIGFYRSRNDGSLELDRQDELMLSLLARRPIPVLVVRQQKNTQGEGRLLIWGDCSGQEGVASAGEIFSTDQWLGIQRPVPNPLGDTADPDKRGTFRLVPVGEEQAVPSPEQPLVEAATAPRKKSAERTNWLVGTVSIFLLLVLVGWLVTDLRPVPAGGLLRAASGEQYRPVVVVPSQNASVRGENSGLGVPAREVEAGTSPDAKALQSLKRWIRTGEDSTLREIAVRELARRGTEDLDALALLAETAQRDTSASVRAAALESIARGWKVNRATRSFFEERARGDESLAVRQTAERELTNASKLMPVASDSTAFREPIRAAAPSTTPPNLTEATPSNPAPAAPQKARLLASPRSAPTAPAAVDLPPPPPVEVARNTPGLPVVQTALSALPNRPVAPSGPAAPIGPVASVRAPAPIAVTAPVLVSQYPAVSVPADIRRLVRSETVIAVHATVDAKGRVSKIHPPEVKGGLHQMLWSIYSNAVRGWAFKPARRDDEVIPGETTLYFRLRPTEGR